VLPREQPPEGLPEFSWGQVRLNVRSEVNGESKRDLKWERLYELFGMNINRRDCSDWKNNLHQ